jgi:hypothetical protein
MGNGLPLTRDEVPPHGRTLSSSTYLSSPPPSAMTTGSCSTYPYYDFQDTDDNDDSEMGGSNNGDLCSSLTGLKCNGGTGDGGTLLSNHSSHHHPYSHQQQHANHVGTACNNTNSLKLNAHQTVCEKVNLDCSDSALNGGRHRHLMRGYPGDSMGRESRDLSKSPLSGRSRSQRGSKGRCMCCMMCIFLLSTAGLGAVLALTYAGKVTLRPPDTQPHATHVTHSNGGTKLDRLGEDKSHIQVSRCLCSRKVG